MSENTANSLILGLMSGTSLDGLDLALCQFSGSAEKPAYKIHKCATVSYNSKWQKKLSQAHQLSAQDFFELHAAYGNFIAVEVLHFLEGLEKPMAIASHGHTIFHQPEKGFSTQLGCGATVAALTGISTVCDFRSMDVALGGQGAPLVPIGDALLFAEYDACLNIGGIANISYETKDGRKAFDICVANMLLNYLAEKKGRAYDADGMWARAGKIEEALIKQLDGLPFYHQKGARSLGREWFEGHVLPLFQAQGIDDLLATATEHIANKIAQEINTAKVQSVLVTGGGAHNLFLIEKIKSLCEAKIIIPKTEIINYKEALIFAYLGHLRLNNRINALSSVTGASRDSVGAAVYAGKP